MLLTLVFDATKVEAVEQFVIACEARAPVRKKMKNVRRYTKFSGPIREMLYVVTSWSFICRYTYGKREKKAP